MFKNWIFTVGLLLLGVALWRSQEFSTIAAGVSVFLFGMLFLKEGFAAFTGGTLENVLRRSTDTLFKSHLFGIVSTSLMQSSSLVSVITISFLSADLIGLTQGIGIIFGANLGTTTGAWLMAAFGMKVKISAYAMPMLVFSLVLTLQRRKVLKGIGSILAGLGFLFLGIHYMKEGFDVFSGSFDLAAYSVGGLNGLLLFAGIGVVATVVMQSSHATLMLIIAALAARQITYDNALALAVGANIGTTITAILGAISANAAGRRLAAAHLIFNATTAILTISFLSQIRALVDWIAATVGLAPDDWTMKLAVFHTVFNLLGVLVMIPLIPTLVRVLEKWVKGAEGAEAARAIYLNDSALQLPVTAMEVLLKETGRLFDNAFEIVAHGLNLHRHDILSQRPIDVVVQKSRAAFDVDVMQDYYANVKSIYAAIVDFATRVRAKGGLSEGQQDEVDSVRIVCRNIAEIVKNVALMRENLTEYLNSDNEHIMREYDVIRLRLATSMRELFRIRDSHDEVDVFMTLTQLKEDLKAADVLANGTLDHLVREGLITGEMATSLMNDSAFAHDTGKRLVEVAERMFLAEGTDLKEIGAALLIDKESMAELADSGART